MCSQAEEQVLSSILGAEEALLTYVGVAEGDNLLCSLFLVAPVFRAGRLWGRFVGVRVLQRFVVALLFGLVVLVGLMLFRGEGSGRVALNAGC